MSASINFYFAEWCPHCHDFMDTWNSIKRKLLKLGYEVNEYKSGTEIGDRMISKDNVPGFPTIMVFIDGEKDGKKMSYDIPIVGDSDEMISKIMSLIKNPDKKEFMSNTFIDNVKKIMDGSVRLGGGVGLRGDVQLGGSYLYPNEDYYKYKYLKYKYKYLKNKGVI